MGSSDVQCNTCDSFELRCCALHFQEKYGCYLWRSNCDSNPRRIVFGFVIPCPSKRRSRGVSELVWRLREGLQERKGGRQGKKSFHYKCYSNCDRPIGSASIWRELHQTPFICFTLPEPFRLLLGCPKCPSPPLHNEMTVQFCYRAFFENSCPSK